MNPLQYLRFLLMYVFFSVNATEPLKEPKFAWKPLIKFRSRKSVGFFAGETERNLILVIFISRYALFYLFVNRV